MKGDPDGVLYCEVCGKPTTPPTLAEEESMMAEAERKFPETKGDEMGIVCDPCYRAFVADFEANPEKYRR